MRVLPVNNIVRLRDFIQSFTQLIDDKEDEKHVFQHGGKLLSELINHDDWLPDIFSQPSPDRYQQYLLYCDPMERFSVVSFVWGPGQSTPIHDHTVWGMVGVMRGAEKCEEFVLDTTTNRLVEYRTHELVCGSIDRVSPLIGDIHKMSNAFSDRVSISIHVYGANIGAVNRHIYEFDTGSKKMFISGYSNDVIPNIWGHPIALEASN